LSLENPILFENSGARIMPNLFEHLDSVQELVAAPPCGLFTDVDGTISPTAPTPAQAQVSQVCRRCLVALAKHLKLVAVVSGRPVVEMREMISIAEIVYIGNHGLEREIGQDVVLYPGAEDYLVKIAQALDEIREHLAIEGIFIQNKGVTASIHYRLCPDQELAREAIFKAIAKSPAARELKVFEGRKVIELRPPLIVNKGAAVLDLVNTYRLRGAIYLGDDLTDVDAFIALRQHRQNQLFNGLNIGVIAEETLPQITREADFTLNGVAEVERFLTWLLQVVSESNPEHP
jgi:trehalose 6-phosphate phosphatase